MHQPTTKEERRAIRREYINYFIQNPDKRMYPIREAVRMMEIMKIGCCLPIFYPNW